MSDPARPLGTEGRRLWDEWDGRVDPSELLPLCETTDERQSLRLAVLRDGTAKDRAALRSLDVHLAAGLDAVRRAASWRVYAEPN